jgi:hypothetical protein
MNTGKLINRAIVVLAAPAATAVVFAGPANADPKSDYLDALASQGLKMDQITTSQLLFYGNMACVDLRAGGQAQANKHLGSLPGSDPALVQVVVNAAQTKLCPETQGR